MSSNQPRQTKAQRREAARLKAKELREAEVPLIVASQCHQAEVVLGHYEAGSTLAHLGAISAHDMTLEALYAKTIFLLSQGLQGEEFAQWMNRSIAGEVSLPGIA